jgi:NAD(P)-dependent dehydrogenase (short-subunit alcohol dehydrogenase family)
LADRKERVLALQQLFVRIQNLNGALLCILSVLPVMRRQKAGRIVNISSVGAFLGSVCAHPAYGVSKAGLIAMTKSPSGRILLSNLPIL